MRSINRDNHERRRREWLAEETGPKLNNSIITPILCTFKMLETQSFSLLTLLRAWFPFAGWFVVKYIYCLLAE